MLSGANKDLAAGTKVKVADAMEVPEWSEWDDDKGRVSTPVKRRLQTLFFKGDKKVHGEVMYIGKEVLREKLRRLGRVKVRVRDNSGSAVVITAEVAKLARTH